VPDNTVDWDEVALEELLNSVDGPVGRYLTEKMLQMTAFAETAAPLQKPRNWSWGRNSTSYMPRSFGYLKSTVRPHMGYTMGGTLFAGTNAAWGPTLFLEYGGGRHGHAERIPFMSAALYATITT
jgi:hypothetical protein